MCGKMFLPDRESNPGLPRDRRRSSPLDYRGQTYGQLLLNNFSRFESWRDPEKNSNFLSLSIENVGADQKMWNASRFCVSSLRRGHANLLCIVPILVYVLPKQVQDELFGTLNHVSVSFDGRRFPRGFSPESFFPEWNFSFWETSCQLPEDIFQG